jgi:dienelactone hydrolase
VVITPIVDERLLLERGIAVVRFRTHWEQLRGFSGARPAAAADHAGDPASEPDPQPDAHGPEPTPGADLHAPAPPTVGAWLLAAPRPGIVGRAYFELIRVDAQDSVPKVVSWLSRLPQVDPDRIAISGSSTSGFAALQALAADPRLANGVVRVACGDYFTFLRDSSLALKGDPRWLVDGHVELDPDYAETLRRIEPIRHADRFPPRPVLLMVGADDPAIPIECARNTADALERAYAAAGMSDRFRFVVFPGQGHNLGTESQREALEWWQHWLVHDSRQAPSAVPAPLSRPLRSQALVGRLPHRHEAAHGVLEEADVDAAHLLGEGLDADDPAQERSRGEEPEEQMVHADDEQR